LSANAQAWSNITGKPTFATVSTSGSYNDLTNTPSIPAAQVNADWSATSGVAQILNKPTIPDAYTLPAATASTLGGVKVGSGLSVSDGTLNVTAGNNYSFNTKNVGTWGENTLYRSSGYNQNPNGFNSLANSPSVSATDAVVVKFEYSVLKGNSYYNSGYYISDSDYLKVWIAPNPWETGPAIYVQSASADLFSLYYSIYYYLP
jgi:hypothetical protein